MFVINNTKLYSQQNSNLFKGSSWLGLCHSSHIITIFGYLTLRLHIKWDLPVQSKHQSQEQNKILHYNNKKLHNTKTKNPKAKNKKINTPKPQNKPPIICKIIPSFMLIHKEIKTSLITTIFPLNKINKKDTKPLTK